MRRGKAETFRAFYKGFHADHYILKDVFIVAWLSVFALDQHAHLQGV